MQSKFRSAVWFTGVSLAAIGAITPAIAQESTRVTDEIVVTAEKREASIQDVPIAISAFDEEKLERMQLNDAQDLQMAIPNFQFAKGNFTGNNVAIRGVGTKLVAASADSAVGIHVNGVPLGQTPIFETEFYDIERVEILRGPQGTLYGRNASSGVLNILTAKPELGEYGGRVEATYGNFNTQRGQFMLNVPFGDSFALRGAGFILKRDGFTNDLNSGQDVDDRDMWSFRVSAHAEMSERADATLMVQFFEEDSKRSRIGKQLCARDDRAWPFSQGCLAEAPQFETVNLSATLGGLGALIFPGADPDGAGPLQATLLIDPALAGPGAGGVNPPDMRDVFLTYLPKHSNDDFLSTFEFNYDFGPITFTALTGYSENQVSSQVDYNQYVGGQLFRPTVFTPTGTFTGPRTGTQSTLATFDDSTSDAYALSQELRLTSNLDGMFNFTVGGIYIHGESRSDYQVISNSLEAIGLGLSFNPTLPPVPQNQWYYENYTDNYTLQAWAGFGEVYFEPTDKLKFTLGLRYTSDDKSIDDRQTLLQRVDKNAVPLNHREASFEALTGRFTVNYVTALPFTDETNFYGSYARGYKGGGVNPPIDPTLFQGVAETFEPEFVNAYEFGIKNTLGDGRMSANFSAFRYDYEDYQISRIVNRTSVNANINASINGIEAEFTWEPIDRLVFDSNIGWLDTEIDNASLIDPIDVTNGDAAYTNVSDALTWSRRLAFDSAGNFIGTIGDAGASLTSLPAGATTRSPRLADLAGANGGTVQAAAGAIVANPALATISTAATCIVPKAYLTGVELPNGTFQGTGYAVATGPLPGALLPFACQLLRGVGGDALAGSDGIGAQLEGNKLPNTPEWTASLGAQYTIPIGTWGLTPRVDYYYQAESFARIFNAPNDELDGYSLWNASLRLDNPEAGFYVNLFVKNVADETVVTDYYLTDQSSGLFTNAFLLEPRTYGITVGKTW